MLKPICVPCQRFFRMVKMGLYFVEGMPVGRIAAVGASHPEQWKPYKIWSGDKWKCQGCGAEIISGTGRDPIAEHYQPDFQATKEKLNADFQVNDC